MEQTDQLDELLSQFPDEYGHPCSLDDEGDGVIVVDNRECFCCSPESSPTLHLTSILATLPHQADAAFYIELLAMNLHGLRTQENALSVDQNGLRILLCGQQETARLTAESFRELVDDFVACCEQLSDDIEMLYQNTMSRSTTAAETGIPV